MVKREMSRENGLRKESMMRSQMGLPSVFSHFAPQQGASERGRRTEREGQAVTAMDEGLMMRSARWTTLGTTLLQVVWWTDRGLK